MPFTDADQIINMIAEEHKQALVKARQGDKIALVVLLNDDMLRDLIAGQDVKVPSDKGFEIELRNIRGKRDTRGLADVAGNISIAFADDELDLVAIRDNSVLVRLNGGAGVVILMRQPWWVVYDQDLPPEWQHDPRHASYEPGEDG